MVSLVHSSWLCVLHHGGTVHHVQDVWQKKVAHLLVTGQERKSQEEAGYKIALERQPWRPAYSTQTPLPNSHSGCALIDASLHREAGSVRFSCISIEP